MIKEQHQEAESREEAVLSKISMGRMGEAKEISAVIAFLCLPAASYITGQIVYADGGLTL